MTTAKFSVAHLLFTIQSYSLETFKIPKNVRSGSKILSSTPSIGILLRAIKHGPRFVNLEPGCRLAGFKFSRGDPIRGKSSREATRHSCMRNERRAEIKVSPGPVPRGTFSPTPTPFYAMERI